MAKEYRNVVELPRSVLLVEQSGDLSEPDTQVHLTIAGDLMPPDRRPDPKTFIRLGNLGLQLPPPATVSEADAHGSDLEGHEPMFNVRLGNVMLIQSGRQGLDMLAGYEHLGGYDSHMWNIVQRILPPPPTADQPPSTPTPLWRQTMHFALSHEGLITKLCFATDDNYMKGRVSRATTAKHWTDIALEVEQEACATFHVLGNANISRRLLDRPEQAADFNLAGTTAKLAQLFAALRPPRPRDGWTLDLDVPEVVFVSPPALG